MPTADAKDADALAAAPSTVLPAAAPVRYVHRTAAHVFAAAQPAAARPVGADQQGHAVAEDPQTLLHALPHPRRRPARTQERHADKGLSTSLLWDVLLFALVDRFNN
jgi:hypothetical protein